MLGAVGAAWQPETWASRARRRACRGRCKVSVAADGRGDFCRLQARFEYVRRQTTPSPSRRPRDLPRDRVVSSKTRSPGTARTAAALILSQQRQPADPTAGHRLAGPSSERVGGRRQRLPRELTLGTKLAARQRAVRDCVRGWTRLIMRGADFRACRNLSSPDRLRCRKLYRRQVDFIWAVGTVFFVAARSANGTARLQRAGAQSRGSSVVFDAALPPTRSITTIPGAHRPHNLRRRRGAYINARGSSLAEVVDRRLCTTGPGTVASPTPARPTT